MKDLPIQPHFETFSLDSLTPDQKELWDELNPDFQSFIRHYNGGRAADHTLNFYTGIPFEDPSPIVPSRTDYISDFLGFSSEEGDEWEDIWGYNVTEQMNVFPEGIIVVARGNYGTVGISLNESDKGAVYYQWTHYPSVAYHYEAKRGSLLSNFSDFGSPEAIRADQYALIEKLADSWTDFLDLFIIDTPADTSFPELNFYTFQLSYEQIRRQCAYHNIMTMAGAIPSAYQEEILARIAGGFLPTHLIEKIRAEAPDERTLFVLENQIADNWILDRMLDIMMLDSPIQDQHYHILIEFGRQAGYPKIEVDNSIADYHARKRREASRQAPPLDIIFQDSRENALAIIQSLYLTGIASGPVTPAQDAVFARLAQANDINLEELKFIVRNREGLEPLLPKFPGWWDEFKNELVRFLKLEGRPKPESLKIAEAIYEKMGLTSTDLYQALDIEPTT